MPSGKTARPNITDNKDGTVTVHYAPSEKGLHEMDIRYDGNHIPGEPLGGTGNHQGAVGATGRWLRKVDTTFPGWAPMGQASTMVCNVPMGCLCGVHGWSLLGWGVPMGP